MSKITYFNEECHLVRSSSLICVPALYGYLSGGNVYAAKYNALSCFISTAFWSRPYYNTRRVVDLCFQPIFATSMFLLGNYFSDSYVHMFIGNALFGSGLLLYHRSCFEYRRKNRFWFVYHCAFHYCMSSSCLLVQEILRKKNVEGFM